MPETCANASAGSAAMARPAASSAAKPNFKLRTRRAAPRLAPTAASKEVSLAGITTLTLKSHATQLAGTSSSAHSGLDDPVSSCPGLKANPCNPARLRA